MNKTDMVSDWKMLAASTAFWLILVLGGAWLAITFTKPSTNQTLDDSSVRTSYGGNNWDQ